MICNSVTFRNLFVTQKMLHQSLYVVGAAGLFLVCNLFFLFYFNKKREIYKKEKKQEIKERYTEVHSGAKNRLQPTNRPQSHISIGFVCYFKKVIKGYQCYTPIGAPCRAMYLLGLFVTERI